MEFPVPLQNHLMPTSFDRQTFPPGKRRAYDGRVRAPWYPEQAARGNRLTEEYTMKRAPVSTRRRQVLIAGSAAMATPAALAAAPLTGHAGPENAAAATARTVVVSGRLLDAGNRPVAGAALEIWNADSRRRAGCPQCASATSDADGRFLFEAAAPADASGRPRNLYYRVSRDAHATPIRPFDLAQSQPDEAGRWRATFGITV